MAHDLGSLGSAYRTDAGSGRRVRLYSRFVKLMKVALPLAAAAGIGLYYLSLREPGDLAEIFSAEDLATLGAGLKLDSPSFTGVNERGEPFSVHAKWAVPDSAMPTYIDLERPSGEIELDRKRTVTVTSETGRLHRDDKVLVLKGGVKVDTSDGYHIETDRLHFALRSQATYAPGSINAKGPSGSIEAGSMRVVPADPDKGTGTQIWFENRVRVVLSPANAADERAKDQL